MESRGAVAAVAGNGVLGAAESARVVFCQLAPWGFDWRQDRDPEAVPLMNLKRTYRRTGVLLSRLLANVGVVAATPLLERVRRPVQSDGERRWLEGFCLDEPEEWDDPYRFFRW